jgi:hypothetical protein
VAFTAYLLVLSVRGGLHPGHVKDGWLLPMDFVLHGWSLRVLNVALFVYLCWLGFCFIRGTQGRERLIMIGCWFAETPKWATSALRPDWALRPEWSVACKYISIIGFTVALLTAVSLMLRVVTDSAGRNGAD